MDQTQNKTPFFCVELENEEGVLPVFGEEAKSESLNFCIRTDAEFTAGPSTEENCLSISSEGSDSVREASVHADVTEISLNSHIRGNNPAGEATGNTELGLTDVWDKLAYDGSLVSFECEQDSWKLENFDDEQFDCLMSQYVPAFPDNNVSASTLPAEALDTGVTNRTDSVCRSSTETEPSEVLSMSSEANTIRMVEFCTAKTSGDKNLDAAQPPSTLADATETDLVSGEQFDSGDSTGGGSDIQYEMSELNSNMTANKENQSENMICDTENNLVYGEQCESGDSTGSGSDVVQNEECELDSNMTARQEHQSENRVIATETNLFCNEQFESSESSGSDIIQNEKCQLQSSMSTNKEDQSKIMVSVTETNLLCDEQFESSSSSGSDVIQNEKCELQSGMSTSKEDQSKNMVIATETNLLCDEQFESSNSSGSDVVQNEKLELNSNVSANKENQSKTLISASETNLFCEEQFESSDSSSSCVILNEKCKLDGNMTSSKENQSKNMANTSDSDTTRMIFSSSLPHRDKNEEIASCEFGQKITMLPCSYSGCTSPLSVLTLTHMVCRLGPPDVVTKACSQAALKIGDVDSVAQIADQIVNPADTLSLASEDLPNRENAKFEEHETRSRKNCESVVTESSSLEELVDSDCSGEVLLLEYSNQEDAGDEVSRGILLSEKIKEVLSDKTSKDEDVLRHGSRTESCDQVLASADVSLSVIDHSEMPRSGSNVVCGQLSTADGNSQTGDLVVPIDIASSITDETHKESSNEVELTALAQEGRGVLCKDMRDSSDMVQQRNEDGLTSENVVADESMLNVQKSTKPDVCGAGHKNDILSPKRGCEENLIDVDEREDTPPADCDIDNVVKCIKKEKPWTFGDRASAGEDSWIDPVPHGLKECFCPHGTVTVQAGHFHCQECGLSTIQKYSIIRHEVMKHRVKHTGIKIKQCTLCPSIFVHSSEFLRHSQRHAQGLLSDCKGDEHKSSDYEITPPDSSVTPSSESSPNRSKSISLRRRCKRSSFGWNWKVAFDFQTQMEQRAKRRKSEQSTSEQKSSAVEEKPDGILGSELLKLSKKYESEDAKETEISHYTVTEISADGTETTTKRPCYNGELLSSLTEPSNMCPICYKRFSVVAVQKSHYGQVHKIYLQGISLYECKPCGICTVKLSDFETHIKREKHRISIKSKASGSAEAGIVAGGASSPVDTCAAATDGSRSSTRKRRSSDCAVTDNLRLLKKVRCKNSSKERSSEKGPMKRPALRRTPDGRFIKAGAEIGKEISTKKISWFYGKMKGIGPSPDVQPNACVSNHVCSSACVCGLVAKDEMPSKEKCKDEKMPDDECNEGIESSTPSELFQPVIVDSFSCLPSAWTNISDIASDENGSVESKAPKDLKFEEKPCKTELGKEFPPQFASNTTRAIKFFQNTRRTIFATPLQSKLTPLATSLQSTLSPLTTSLQSTLPPLATSLQSTLTPLTTSLQSTLTPLTTSLQSTLTPLTTSLQSTLTPLTTSLQSTLTRLTTSLQSTLPPLTTSLQSTLTPLTTSLQSTLTPLTTSLQSTFTPKCLQTVPQIKPRSQVALKSTSQQKTHRRSKDSDEERLPRPDKTHSRDNSHDINNSIIIHVSDDESDSSHTPAVAFNARSCKTEIGRIELKSATVSSEVRHKAIVCGNLGPVKIRQVDDISTFCSPSRNRRSVNTPSTSRSVDVKPTERGVLSDFHSDDLCNELQRRGFMKKCTCGVFFLGLPTYNLHCAWHSSGSPLRCSFCKAVTRDWYEFFAHIQNHCK